MVSRSVLFAVAMMAGAFQQPGPPSSPPTPPLAIDVVTVPPGVVLAPADVSVSVDGRPRKVVSIRQVLRGPGSERIASGANADARPIAEPARTIIVVVDETSIARGSEKKSVSTIARLLDLIGPSDLAAFVTLPVERAAAIAMTTDRQALWSGLARIRGRAASAPLAQARTEQPPAFSDEETPDVKNPTSDERPPTASDRQPGLAREPATRQEPDEGRPTVTGELRSLLSAVREAPGPKTILLIRGASPVEALVTQEGAANERLEALALAPLAAAARVTLHAVTLDDRSRSGGDGAARLARLTGGDEFRLGKQADRELQRLGTWMSEGFRIALEGTPEDRDGRPHQVSVTTRRRDAAVRAPEQWVPFEAPERSTGAAAQPPAIAAPLASSKAPAAPPTTTPIDPDLDRVLARMSAYVNQYVEDFSAVVAEEAYRQNVTTLASVPRRSQGPNSRELRSDFLLVRLPGAEGWTPFRDVFEVNGKPVRDRDDRLRKLFLEMPPDALDKARRILDEGARYNIGSVYRNINQPVVPLMFLLPSHIGGLQFRRAGEDLVEGIRAARIDFEETARPTLIKDDVSHRDVPSSGVLWVDPVTGRIVKTRIRTGDATFSMDTTVLYRRSETLNLWAPAEMEELYTTRGERISGLAKYKNFRRFRVDVEEKIALPKN